MPYMPETEIMTLGRLRGFGAMEPMLRSTWMEPRRVTPQQPQNLMRVVALSGIHRTTALLAGLGQAAEAIVDPVIGPTASDPVASLPGMPKWPWQKDVPPSVSLGAALAVGSLSLVSAAVSGYHGYRRDRSAMAGVGWAFMGMLFPVIVPVFAFGQGYARPRGRR